MNRRTSIVCIALVAVALLPGCSKRFFIRAPVHSSVVYASGIEEAAEVSVRDARSEADKPVSIGRLTAVLDGLEGDEMGFLEMHLLGELRARGIELERGGGDSAVRLDVRKFRIRNHRSSGYSPYYTFSTISADLHHGGSTHRVTAYFKNGKVPVWAFREVEEPTYNIPISLMIKELASKVNDRVFEVRASDAEVARIRSEIDGHAKRLRYLKVFELGYTNNPAAISHLLELVDHTDPMVRSAAISSLGILRASGEFGRLRDYYHDRGKLEKLMALKAIGDLGTPEALAFLAEIQNSRDYRKDTIREVIDLYL
jgi:hypothetical protein